MFSVFIAFWGWFLRVYNLKCSSYKISLLRREVLRYWDVLYRFHWEFVLLWALKLAFGAWGLLLPDFHILWSLFELAGYYFLALHSFSFSGDEDFFISRKLKGALSICTQQRALRNVLIRVKKVCPWFHTKFIIIKFPMNTEYSIISLYNHIQIFALCITIAIFSLH